MVILIAVLLQNDDTETTSSDHSQNMESSNYSVDSSLPELQAGPVHSPLPSQSLVHSESGEESPVHSPIPQRRPVQSQVEDSPAHSPLPEQSPVWSQEDGPVHSPLPEQSPVRSQEDSPVHSLHEQSPVPSHLGEHSPVHSFLPVLSQIPRESPDHLHPPDSNSATDIGDIIKKLQQHIEREPPRANIINVYREDVLDCAVQAFQRQRFNAEARIDVAFVNVQGRWEGSVDEGGPRCEFLCLLMNEVQRCKIFEGTEESWSLALNGDGK